MARGRRHSFVDPAGVCGCVYVHGLQRYRASASVAGRSHMSLGLLVDDAMITVEMMVRKIEEGARTIKPLLTHI